MVQIRTAPSAACCEITLLGSSVMPSPAKDVFIVLSGNAAEDWSFGNGKAQMI
ncbi:MULTISPECIES: tautomerase family protein [Bacillus amyloliquefaciens group]|uniref:tautomerase family protein n=1 Tax=Bacillus amyloliquefaciens group TaxID=1938374 RepID=UPI001F3AC7F2|nr:MULTISPECIES: tautomerase family protein [Bacillus amyloliquefaciens group]